METKLVVWDAIQIAIGPEQMFWGAGIEVYLLVSSKAPLGTEKFKKGHYNFGFSDRAEVILLTQKF